ncbi:SMP-30/gluconolactonase/LRE family protein [Streptomyces sp. NPDC059176]|uniref:SMP-30/gluconolactonase/LRE family protein n=1 Tax=unclassified Streptomyces TaxID=2593676 RepID=UPI0036A99EAB
MAAVRTLMTGLVLGESPRWHDGRLWFCDWGAHEVLAVDPGGRSEVVVRVPSFPFCIDWLPDGRLLVVSGSDRLLLRQEPDGSLVSHADLADLCDRPWNEIAVAASGNVYLNSIGFDMMAGENPSPGILAVVTPDGSTRQVADDVAFPNGMAVTPDGSTLILAESHASRLTAFDIEDDGGLSNRRIWARLDAAAPDGICLDAEGAVWYADVPNKRCVRVREGGKVLQTVELDLGCFSCALGGADGRTLFITAAQWQGPESAADGTRTGRVLAVDAPIPGARRP